VLPVSTSLDGAVAGSASVEGALGGDEDILATMDATM
jgi:hypothetical protein